MVAYPVDIQVVVGLFLVAVHKIRVEFQNEIGV